jgi:NADH-quinone oxidoreductase subunit J
LFDQLTYTIYLLSYGILLAQVIGGAIIAVTSKRLVYAFFGLICALLGVAGLYYHLGSPLVAVMQVMIYIGAVCVAIAFGISLTSKSGEEGIKPPGFKIVVPLALVLLMLGTTLKSLASREWVGSARKIDEAMVGWLFLEEYLLPFEIISILLTVAVIGAVTVALLKRRT